MSEGISYGRVADSARAWWQALQPVGADGSPNPTGDRAALARLRRTATPADAMVEEATLDLFRRLGFGRDDYHRLSRVAVVAIVLAHVREDLTVDKENGRPLSAPARVGRRAPDDEDSALMKPLRFRRLLARRDDEELAYEMRRLVALANRKINVGDLAASLFFWTDRFRGDRIRTRWAFDYYAAGFAAPRGDGDAPEAVPLEAPPA